MNTRSALIRHLMTARLKLACFVLFSGAALADSPAQMAEHIQPQSFSKDGTEKLLRASEPVRIEQLLEHALVLKKNQDWARLFDLLYPQEVHHAGHSGFDNLLGLAASQVGELTRAIMAYERVLDVEPENVTVKSTMASLYFRTGENKDAQALFQALKNSPLPSEIMVQMGHYLRALDERMRKLDDGWKIWSSLSAGHDSNLNYGTDLKSVKLPVSGDVQLAAEHEARRKSSAMSQGVLGLRWSHLIDDADLNFNRCRLLAEASVQVVDYARWSDFSTQSRVLESSLNCPQEDPRQQWQIALQAKNDRRDHQSVRNSHMLRGLYYWSLEGASQLTASLQSSRLDYPQDNLRDGDQHATSLGWMAKLGEQEKWLVGASVGAVAEKVRHAQRQHQAYRSVNWQAHARYNTTSRTAVQLFVSQEKRRYQATDTVFLDQRHDRLRLWGAAMSLTPVSRYESQWTLSVTGQINTSSLGFYSYRRTTPSINWRAAF
jgi:outer membrane protein